MSVRLDASRRELVGSNRVMSKLSEAEFALLETLLHAEGGIVSREQLGRAALKRIVTEDDRSIDQLVFKLRRKLVQHGLGERAIRSTRGLGYSLSQPKSFEIARQRPAAQEPETTPGRGARRPDRATSFAPAPGGRNSGGFDED